MDKPTALSKVFKDYAALQIPFEKFEHEVQSFMKYSKTQTEGKRTFAIDYNQQGKIPNFEVNVSSSTIVNVLQRYLERQVSLKETENWANSLLMSDHFTIAVNEPSARRDPVLDALHQIASWLESMSSQDIQGYISRIKEHSV